jgi:hypothetical protein
MDEASPGRRVPNGGPDASTADEQELSAVGGTDRLRIGHQRRRIASAAGVLVTAGSTLTIVALTMLICALWHNMDGYKDWPFQSSIFADGGATRVEVPNPGGTSYLWSDGQVPGLACSARSEITGEPIALRPADADGYARPGGKQEWRPWRTLRTNQAGVEITCTKTADPSRVWPEVFIDRTYGPPALDFLGSTWRAPAIWLTLGAALIAIGLVVGRTQRGRSR